MAAVRPDDATLQAFADTLLPGRKAAKTDLGDEIDPLAIAGVDSEPGAVEADALRAFHDPLIGFDALEPSFLADLNGRVLAVVPQANAAEAAAFATGWAQAVAATRAPVVSATASGARARRQARVSTGTISLSAGLPRSTAASRRSTIQARRA